MNIPQYKTGQKASVSPAATLTDDSILDELAERQKNNIFPLDVFPEALKPFINDLVLKDLDRGYIGGSLLAAYSTAIGNRFKCNIKQADWELPMIIWMGIVGRTSSGKSMTIKSVMKPLKQYNDNLMMQDDEQEVPKRILLQGSATYEVLSQKLLTENRAGLLKWDDELRNWIEGIGQYSKKSGPEETFWLSVWDGEANIEAYRSKKTTVAKDPFVSILGGIQPVYLSIFFDSNHLYSGMTSRILFALPQNDLVTKTVMHKVGEDNEKKYADSVKDILSIDTLFNKISSSKQAWDFYQKEFDGPWVDLINDNDEIDGVPTRGGVDGAFGKMRAYFWRIAGIMAIMEESFKPSENRSYGSCVIKEEHVMKSKRICEYFMKSFCNAYATNANIKAVHPDAWMLISMLRQGLSYRRIAESFRTSTGKMVDHTTIARMVKKFTLEYPVLFSGKK